MSMHAFSARSFDGDDGPASEKIHAVRDRAQM
jgi:hypothetical protein